MRINRQHVPAIVLTAMAGIALIVTWMLITSVWSGLRLTSRMGDVNLRLAPPEKHVAVEAVSEQKKPEGPDASQPTAPNQSDNPTAANMPGEQKPEQKLPDPPALAVARIKARNMFMVPQKPDFRNILGILGDSVLYPGGISLKVGEQHNGATIKEIGSNWVKVEYEGEIIPLGVYGGTPPQEVHDEKLAADESNTQPSNKTEQTGVPEAAPAESKDTESPQPKAMKPLQVK